MNIIFESRSSVILFNFLNGISKKKPFILPSNICPIVIATFYKAKTPFVFFDISKDTLEMDQEIILDEITKKSDYYGGLLWLRSYGNEKNDNKFFEILKSINDKLYIIDDRCLCKPNFSPIYNHQDLILYSTGYSKYIDYGWGGFGFLNQNIKFYNELKLKYNPIDLTNLNNSFQESINKNTKFSYSDTNWLGGKKRLDLIFYKNKISKDLIRTDNHKKKINSIYSSLIVKDSQFDAHYQNWRFNIYVNQKNKLLEKLFSNNLFASSHYYPMSKMLRHGKSINSEKLYDKIINLFNDKRYNEDMALQTSHIVNEHLLKWGYR